MESRDLISMFEINHSALHANIESVSEDESLISPEKGGNNMNWVVGHIVMSRDVMLETLGMEKFLTKKESFPYLRGANTQETPVNLAFSRLVKVFDSSQDLIVKKLNQLSPEELNATNESNDKQQPKASLADYLRFLHFHETYHIGQTGLLRRIIGKEGAIA